MIKHDLGLATSIAIQGILRTLSPAQGPWSLRAVHTGQIIRWRSLLKIEVGTAFLYRKAPRVENSLETVRRWCELRDRAPL